MQTRCCRASIDLFDSIKSRLVLRGWEILARLFHWKSPSVCFTRSARLSLDRVCVEIYRLFAFKTEILRDRRVAPVGHALSSHRRHFYAMKHRPSGELIVRTKQEMREASGRLISRFLDRNGEPEDCCPPSSKRKRQRSLISCDCFAKRIRNGWRSREH